MIGFLRGRLMAKNPPSLLLDVQGVGYEVEAPMTTFYQLPELGEEVKLHTHLVVREDAHILFGFATLADRRLFRTLIKVNGVGPKLALTILSGQSAGEFHRCISASDTQALVRLPGIGKKTAERLIIEMRDKLPDIAALPVADGALDRRDMPLNDPRQEAVSALLALGYKAQDANRMVQNIPAENTRCEEIIRIALQGAGK